ncbi:hypothetical protein [Clostridium sp.]|uniref:hypothetical protein n=1 Tax=Clostridium sp. TaxID=1506 RepID=UPI003F311950
MNLKRISSTAMAILIASGPVLGSVGIVNASEITNNQEITAVNDTEVVDTEVEKKILSINNTNKEEIDEAKKKRAELTIDSSDADIYSADQIKLLKYEFQQENGVEDEFKEKSNIDGLKVETNGYRGIIRITKNGEAPYELNYFDVADQFHLDAMKSIKAPSRPGAWRTQGPDYANMKVVKGSPRDTIYAYHPGNPNLSKKYTKDTNSWYSGSTKGYYDYVQRARQSYGTSKTNMGSGVIAAFNVVLGTFIKNGKWKVTTSELKGACGDGIIGGAINFAIGVAHGVTYLSDLGNLKSHYDKL